jgi:hypothetical protein
MGEKHTCKNGAGSLNGLKKGSCLTGQLPFSVPGGWLCSNFPPIKSFIPKIPLFLTAPGIPFLLSRPGLATENENNSKKYGIS